MKIFYFFIVLLFLCVDASAQIGDTVKKEIAKKAGSVTFEELKKNWSKVDPLFLVNGWDLKDSLSKEGLKRLKSEDVSGIDELNPTEAVKIYGSKGKNGVVMLTINPGLPDADQPLDPPQADSSLYVIDGVPAKNKLEGIDPKGILSINVISKDKAAEIFNNAGQGVVVVVTKAGAVKSYQNKFSAISAAYKAFLKRHNSDDSCLQYSIDGYECDKGMDGLTRLYNLPKEKIAEIKISAKGELAKAVITTKK